MVAVVWNGMPPASEILPPPESGCTPGVKEIAEKTVLLPPARKFTGNLRICSDVLESTMVEASV